MIIDVNTRRVLAEGTEAEPLETTETATDTTPPSETHPPAASTTSVGITPSERSRPAHVA